MNIREFRENGAAILLVVALLAINELPFLITLDTSHELVFLILSALHAELCLILAWWLWCERVGGLERWLWGSAGLLTVCLAATALCENWNVIIPGMGSTSGMPSTYWGLFSVALAGCPVLGFFTWSWHFQRLRWIPGSPARVHGGQLHLGRLIWFVAATGYLSLLARRLATLGVHWNLSVVDPSSCLFIGIQCAVTGLLAAPCALVVLKPNRYSTLWLGYFVVLCALEPLAEWAIGTVSIGQNQGIIWPESYLSVVIDNLTWYGPQLLPTAALFLLLRLSGVHVAEKK